MYPPILDKKIEFAMNTEPIHLDMIQGDYKCGSLELVFPPAEMKLDKSMKLDKAWWTIKERMNDRKFVVQKTLGNGVEQVDTNDDRFIYTFALYPEDTENLTSGEYVYDIRVKINDSKFTVMHGNMTILPSITGKEAVINEQ